MALETVEKLSFFRQSVFWLRKTRTSESSHTETFSLLKYENRGTRPRFSCVCAANAFECALPRDCCFGVKTDFIDRLRCHPKGWHFCFMWNKGMEQMTKLFHMKHRRETGRDCFTWNLFRAVYVPRETTYTLANSCFTWNIFRRRKTCRQKFWDSAFVFF